MRPAAGDLYLRILLIFCFLSFGLLSAAQAAPNAQKTQALKPTRNLAGKWAFNTDESDDPRSKMQMGRSRRGGQPGGGMGGGYPGGGGWGMHRGGGMRGRSSDADRRKMREILRPARQLTISQTDGEINLSDDQNNKSEFYTDGRKTEKSKVPNIQPYAAQWEDYRLVSEEKGPHGIKIVRSFEVFPGTGQLYETLQLSMGRNNRQITLRYVYDQKASGAGPAPNQH